MISSKFTQITLPAAVSKADLISYAQRFKAERNGPTPYPDSMSAELHFTDRFIERVQKSPCTNSVEMRQAEATQFCQSRSLKNGYKAAAYATAVVGLPLAIYAALPKTAAVPSAIAFGVAATLTVASFVANLKSGKYEDKASEHRDNVGSIARFETYIDQLKRAEAKSAAASPASPPALLPAATPGDPAKAAVRVGGREDSHMEIVLGAFGDVH